MTIQEWKALIRMTSTSTNSFSGHYKGVPVELSSNSTLTRVWITTNHEDVVPPMTFMPDSPLGSLYRNVFKELYNTWYNIKVDNLPF